MAEGQGPFHKAATLRKKNFPGEGINVHFIALCQYSVVLWFPICVFLWKFTETIKAVYYLHCRAKAHSSTAVFSGHSRRPSSISNFSCRKNWYLVSSSRKVLGSDE